MAAAYFFYICNNIGDWQVIRAIVSLNSACDNSTSSDTSNAFFITFLNKQLFFNYVELINFIISESNTNPK